jgi:hypothetical protein
MHNLFLCVVICVVYCQYKAGRRPACVGSPCTTWCVNAPPPPLTHRSSFYLRNALPQSKHVQKMVMGSSAHLVCMEKEEMLRLLHR